MRLLSIAVLFMGCSGKKDDSKPAPAPAPHVETCAERVGRVEHQLRELVATRPGFLPIVQGIDAPTASGATPIKNRGLVLAVTKDGNLFMQGARLDGLEDARSYVDAVFKQVLEAHVMGGGAARDLQLPVYIWADREAPAAVVAALARAADVETAMPRDRPPTPPPRDKAAAAARQAAIEQARAAGILGPSNEPHPSRIAVRLLVAAGKPDPRPTSPAAAKLPASEPEATKYVADQLRTAIGGCSQLITSFGTASLEGLPAKEADKLVKDVPAGLTACACKLGNPDAFEWALGAWFGAWAPPLAAIDVPKIAEGDKSSIGAIVK